MLDLDQDFTLCKQLLFYCDDAEGVRTFEVLTPFKLSGQLTTKARSFRRSNIFMRLVKYR